MSKNAKHLENKVSVIIPTHNRMNLIERAVKSVLNQSYSGIEIIVVSDGSEDDTDSVMEKLCEEDSRIKYISYHPAKGANVARNVGIDNAKYEYVAFLDDDDEWLADKLDKQLALFSENEEIGLVCTGYNSIFVSEGTSSVFIPPAPFDSSREILLGNCIGSTTTVMIKKDLFSQCGKFDSKLQAMQDYDLWTRLCQVTKVGVVKEPCVNYYNYSVNNQISQHTERYIAAGQYIDKKYEGLYNQLSSKEHRTKKNRRLIGISKKGIRNGQPKLARKYALKALRYKITKQSIMCLFASFIPNKMIIHKLRSYLAPRRP